MSNRNPAMILYDADGNPVATLDGYNLSPISPGIPVMGQKDDGTATFLKTTDDGYLITNLSGGPISIAEPVSVDDNGGSLTIDTSQLPISLVGGRLDVNNGAWLGSVAPTVGQKTMADSIPIAIASNQTVIPINDNGGSLTVDGTVTANAGTGPWPVTDNGGSLTVDTPQLPISLVGGRLDANIGAWFNSTAPTVGQKAMVNSIPVTISNDQSAISVSTGGAAVGIGAIASFLTNGGSEDMVVNGSGTPVVFTFDADATDDIQISSLRFVISVGGSFDFDGNTFGDGGSALSNGVEVDLVANGGVFSDLITTFTVNEDFARLLNFQPFSDIDAVITASLPFGGSIILEGGSSDKITVTINDNVALGARGIDYFTATVYGVVLS